MQNKDIRGLSKQEMAAIPMAIKKSLNLDKIKIYNQRWSVLTPPNITVARGYKIFWPGAPVEAETIPHLAHLVHEVVHIWQYNVLGVGLYSWRWLDRRYRYDLNIGDKFLDFGLEQQASIIEDAFRVSRGHGPRRAVNETGPEHYGAVLQQI